MTVKEYLECKDQQQKKEYNKELISKYPFIQIHPNESDYEFTWMDDMPDGWRIAFGDKMLDEIKEELVKLNYLKDYRIAQIKEKYGELRWYDYGCIDCSFNNEFETVTITRKEFNENCFNRNKEYYYIIKETDGDIYTCEKYKVIYNSKFEDIINKYTEISRRTCIECGNPATQISQGWISPYCDECAKEIHDTFKPIEESVYVGEVI